MKRKKATELAKSAVITLIYGLLIHNFAESVPDFVFFSVCAVLALGVFVYYP